MARFGVATTASAVVGQIGMATERSQGELAGALLGWSNAGHPPPMLVRSNGEVIALEATPGEEDVLLGVVPNGGRHEDELQLATGDVVVFYTDGLVERCDQSLGTGLEQLMEFLQLLGGQPLADICDEVLEKCVPEHLDDDIAVVAVGLFA